MSNKFVIIKPLEDLKQYISTKTKQSKDLEDIAGRVCLVTLPQADNILEIYAVDKYLTISDKYVLRDLEVGDLITTEHGELSVKSVQGCITAGTQPLFIKPEEILSVRANPDIFKEGTAVRLKSKEELEKNIRGYDDLKYLIQAYGGGVHFISRELDDGRSGEIISDTVTSKLAHAYFEEVKLPVFEKDATLTLKSVIKVEVLSKLLSQPKNIKGGVVDIKHLAGKKLKVLEDKGNFVRVAAHPYQLTIHKALFIETDSAPTEEVVMTKVLTPLEKKLETTKLLLANVEKAVELEKSIMDLKESIKAKTKERKDLNKLIEELEASYE